MLQSFISHHQPTTTPATPAQCSNIATMTNNENQGKRPCSKEAIERMIAELQDAIERVDALRETVAQVKEDDEWRPPRTPSARPGIGRPRRALESLREGASLRGSLIAPVLGGRSPLRRGSRACRHTFPSS